MPPSYPPQNLTSRGTPTRRLSDTTARCPPLIGRRLWMGPFHSRSLERPPWLPLPLHPRLPGGSSRCTRTPERAVAPINVGFASRPPTSRGALRLILNGQPLPSPAQDRERNPSPRTRECGASQIARSHRLRQPLVGDGRTTAPQGATKEPNTDSRFQAQHSNRESNMDVAEPSCRKGGSPKRPVEQLDTAPSPRARDEVPEHVTCYDRSGPSDMRVRNSSFTVWSAI